MADPAPVVRRSIIYNGGATHEHLPPQTMRFDVWLRVFAKFDEYDSKGVIDPKHHAAIEKRAQRFLDAISTTTKAYKWGNPYKDQSADDEEPETTPAGPLVAPVPETNPAEGGTE